MKPTIFLDLDGVMCTTTQYHTNRKKWHPEYDCYRFDEKCVKILNEIIEKTNPIVILSSDWKTRYNLIQLNAIFKWNGVNCEITDITPDLWGVLFQSFIQLEECRANEILKYVKDHEIINYVAIDDLDLRQWIPNNFVWCTRQNEGIKQSGVKDKILKLIGNVKK